MTTHGGSAHASLPLSFGPRQLVATAAESSTGAGCGACDDNGVIHAFWSYQGDDGKTEIPDVSPLTYLIGLPGAISAYPIGDVGQALAAAVDGGTVHLLYSNNSGVHLAEVQADGSFSTVRLLSSNEAVQGALVADQGGWWAVWIEEDFRLFEAFGGWGNGDFPRQPVTSELTSIGSYDSPSLALGPRDPAHPGDRLIYLSWAMIKENGTTVVRLATTEVQPAKWREQPWLPTAAMHSDLVDNPALVYDGVLQAAYVRSPSVGYMRNPSQSATPQPLSTTSSGKPYITASAGRTLVAWVEYDDTGQSSLWVAGPGEHAVKLTRQLSAISILSLTSYKGNAVLLTTEDDDQSVYLRIQAS